MAVPLVSGSHPRAARAAPSKPRSSASRALMGLYGLLLAGWCAVMIVMTDSPTGIRVRTIMLFALVAVVAYRISQETNKLPDGATGVIVSGLAGLIAGAAVASMVKLLGPSSIIPAALVILTFAIVRWLIGSFRRASAFIDQTTADLVAADQSEPSSVTSLPHHAGTDQDHQPPSRRSNESEHSSRSSRS